MAIGASGQVEDVGAMLWFSQVCDALLLGGGIIPAT